jgi:hypothetical protein
VDSHSEGRATSFVNGFNDRPQTIVIPLKAGEAFPKLFSNKFVDDPALLRIPGARVLNVPSAFPGPDPTTYAIWRTNTHRNLYKISLPDPVGPTAESRGH